MDMWVSACEPETCVSKKQAIHVCALRLFAGNGAPNVLLFELQ